MLKRFMKRQALARRIILAFTLMAVVLGGTLSSGIILAVHYVEKSLLSRAFVEKVARIADDLRQGKAPYLEEGTQFFILEDPDNPVPPAFRNARAGFSEVEDGGRDYWVYSRREREGGERYLIVKDQWEFEKHERILKIILWVSLLTTILGAFALGRLMARRVMSPVTRLADEVRALPITQAIAPLAENYADDEVGQLAHAFDEVFSRLRFSIEKERLFTSDVSHELRTPLMIISSSCELLQAADLSAQGKEQVKRIANAAREMQALTETFLALARAESGKLVDATDSITLCALAKDASRQWSEAAAAKGLCFELCEEGKDEGRYHAVLLRTVVDNLLRNAIYYTERGWIRLTLTEGGFRVEDSGVGIPDSEKKDLFQPFMRGARARGEGEGLGLSLVQRIAKQQGWQVLLENLPAGGSRFTVWLKEANVEGGDSRGGASVWLQGLRE